MERIFDIFEILADGTRLWRGAVTGQATALWKIQKLAANSLNEFRLMHLPTDSLVVKLPAKG